MLDLYKLEIFTLVVQEGSFTGASQRLLMTQSGISQHMRDLEASLGAKLFERGRRGVTLTPAGEQLIGYAQTILRLVSEAQNAVTDVDRIEGGQVVISATPGVSVYLLPGWMRAFRARHPNLTVALHTATTPQVIRTLRSERMALGVVEGELDDITVAQIGVLPLLAVEQYVIIGRGHRWWGRTSVALGELAGEPLITRQADSQTRRWLDQMLRQHGVQPHIAAEFDNLESIKRSVIGGECATILPPYVIEQERELGAIVMLPIDGAPLLRTIKLLWNPQRLPTPPARAFLRVLAHDFPVIAEILG